MYGALSLIAVVALVAAACGGDDDDASEPSSDDGTESVDTADTGDTGDTGDADGTADAGTADGEGTGSADAEADSDVTIGVSFYDSKVIPLYVEMEEGMTEAAAEAGVDITFSYAAFDPVAQVDQIETMITNGVDVILATPLDPTVLLTAYESAADAGIPIISFANKVDDDAEELFIGRDWAFAGEANMEAVVEALDGAGTVALMTGPPELEVVRSVNAGWQSILAENPDVVVVDTLVNPDMSTTVALDLSNTLFAANPDVDAVVCTIDQMCLGVAQAVDEQGIDQSAVFIASMDADSTAVEQVRDGTGIDQTFSMKGVTWGRQSVDVALAFLAGEVPAEHTVPNAFTRIGPDNVADLTDEDLR
jgi:ABC-type sugar transport system substrate-binding protein